MSRIYMVDDHRMLRDGLRAVLQHAGHEVVGETDTPAEALADLQRLAPDVLLLDLNLGDHCGLVLLDELRRRRIGVRVAVLSMSGQPQHVAEALRLGALAYLLKSARAGELLQAIDAVVQGKRFLGADVADLAVRGLTAARESDALDTLSNRERQIVQLVVRGRSSADIGRLLNLSPKTVDTYRSRLMRKLGVADTPALVRLAVREGLIDAAER